MMRGHDELAGGPADDAVVRAAKSHKPKEHSAEYVREKRVENRLRMQARKRPDRCMLEKHVSPGRRGVPDDLITWGHPLCIMELIETKAPKGRLAEHQKRDHAQRSRYGIKVHTLYTVEQVDAYFATMDHLMRIV